MVSPTLMCWRYHSLPLTLRFGVIWWFFLAVRTTISHQMNKPRNIVTGGGYGAFERKKPQPFTTVYSPIYILADREDVVKAGALYMRLCTFFRHTWTALLNWYSLSGGPWILMVIRSLRCFSFILLRFCGSAHWTLVRNLPFGTA